MRLGWDEASGRELFALALGSLDDPPPIRLPSRHWLCLVAGDTHRATDGEIHALARRLLDGGAVYVVVWGAGAERTHALLRDAVLIAEHSQAEETLVMTSSHDGSLEEALAFVLTEATPSAAYAESCGAVLIVTLDAPAAAVVRAALSSPADFLARMAG